MYSRRTLLAAIGAAGVGTIAGCAGESDGGGSTPTGERGDGSTRTGREGDGSASPSSGDPAPADPLTGSWRSNDSDAGNTNSNTAMDGPTTEPSVHHRMDLETGFVSHPVVEDGHIFVNTAETLYALSPTGEQRWTFVDDSDNRRPMTVAPAVRDGTVYLHSGDSLIALSDGERRWSANWGDSGRRSPITTESALYATTGRGLRSYTLDGDLRWEQSHRYVVGRPAVGDSTVYQRAIAADQAAPLFARNTSDGELKWTVDNTIGRVPVVSDGTVYTYRKADSGLVVAAIDGADGSIVWERRAVGRPVVADGTVYTARGSRLHAIDAADGSLRWETPYEASGRIITEPAVDANSVYLLLGQSVVAVDRERGTERWSVQLPEGNPVYDLKGLCLAGGRVYAARRELYEIY